MEEEESAASEPDDQTSFPQTPEEEMQYYMTQIHAPEAWELLSQTEYSRVRAAVIDSLEVPKTKYQPQDRKSILWQ